ncbi:MAG: cbb3-type cytochrome c oxidase subunit 3 [Proteobacteria bacterium]|nr:cbb3-type cytochrome c oxidase subunit 3 [Pseudomonadota bacterium]HQR03457.1 cbb3-type cytochrome c oxidase subunit 3 [Rhodocyclaceae bacterium]
MGINELRSVITLVTFLVFVGIVFWAYSSRRKDEFDAAAMLPWDDDEPMTSDQSHRGATNH